MGHEFTGEVVEAGSAVKTVKKGDRIVTPFTVSWYVTISRSRYRVNGRDAISSCLLDLRGFKLVGDDRSLRTLVANVSPF